MKPFDEVKHLPTLFRQLSNNAERLKLCERIREITIERLTPIAPPGQDLRNFDCAFYFCHYVQGNPEYTPYWAAATILSTCNNVLESGKVEQHHIDWIITSSAGLDKRWAAKLKQLSAHREKKNKALLKYCNELMQAKPSPTAASLFRRIPKQGRAVTVDGFTIYRADIDGEGEEKIYCISPTGKQTTVGDHPFYNYFKAIKAGMTELKGGGMRELVLTPESAVEFLKKY